MSGSHKSAILALVHDRGIVTLESLCRQLSGLAIDDIAPELLGEIDATLREAGWIHSTRAADGEIPADIYERPMQDIPRNSRPPAARPASASTLPNAVTILYDAAKAIEDRAAARDMPAERSMARTVAAFNALTGHSLSECEGWLFMATLKGARATAGAHNGDDYTDGAAYFALAGECAAKGLS